LSYAPFQPRSYGVEQRSVVSRHTDGGIDMAERVF